MAGESAGLSGTTATLAIALLRTTIKSLGESALSLALAPDALSGGRKCGSGLTPAAGIDHVLVERLRKADVTIDIGV